MYYGELKGKIKEIGFDGERKMWLDKVGKLQYSNKNLENAIKKV